MDPEVVDAQVPVVADLENKGENTTSAGVPNGNVENEKTEQLVASLENGVEKAYTALQQSAATNLAKLQGIVGQVHVNVPVPKLDNSGELLSKASERTNQVLDSIDEDLEKLENLTLDYAQQIGKSIGSFINTSKTEVAKESRWGWLSGLVGGGEGGGDDTRVSTGDTNGEKTAKVGSVASQGKDGKLLFLLPSGILPGTRAETQMHELQSDAAFYIQADKDGEFAEYKLTEEDEAEREKLGGNQSLHLMATFNDVVTSKKVLTESKFWQIYFGRKQAIIDADQRRRELIQDKSDVRETGVADTDNTNTKEGQAGHAGHAARGSVSESGNAGTAGDDDDDENFDWDE